MYSRCPGSQTKYWCANMAPARSWPGRGSLRCRQEAPAHRGVWRERPGYLVAGEVATLLDRGHQKFWNIKRLEVPATAESLQAVHRFAEELREVIGEPSLYNDPWERPATAIYTIASKGVIFRLPSDLFRRGNCLPRVVNDQKRNSLGMNRLSKGFATCGSSAHVRWSPAWSVTRVRACGIPHLA